jgi:chromosome segregation ATPase
VHRVRGTRACVDVCTRRPFHDAYGGAPHHVVQLQWQLDAALADEAQLRAALHARESEAEQLRAALHARESEAEQLRADAARLRQVGAHRLGAAMTAWDAARRIGAGGSS